MQNTISGISEKTTISIGSDPIDKALLGGLPLGSLSLIEGPSGVGKSVVIQHFAFGALMAELGVAYYVSGMDQESLVGKMNSLYLEVDTFLGEGQLIIYPVSDFYDGREDAPAALRKIRKHMEQLPWDVNVIVVDTLTNLVNQAGNNETFNFFMSCKEICSWDKTLLFAMHTASMDPDLLLRLDKLFDTHLTLRVEALSQGVCQTACSTLSVLCASAVSFAIDSKSQQQPHDPPE